MQSNASFVRKVVALGIFALLLLLIVPRTFPSAEASAGRLIGLTGLGLVEINPQTGAGTLISAPGGFGFMQGVGALDPATHRFFVPGTVQLDEENSENRLFAIDTQTGAVVSNPLIPYTPSAIAFDPASGNVLGIMGKQLVSINPQTGAMSDIGTPLAFTSFAQGVATFDPVHHRYFIPAGIQLDEETSESRLFVVDTLTGNVLANPLMPSVGTIEYDESSDQLYGTFGLGLYDLDWNTGQTQLVGEPFTHGYAQAVSAYDPVNHYFFLPGDILLPDDTPETRLFSTNTVTGASIAEPLLEYWPSVLKYESDQSEPVPTATPTANVTPTATSTPQINTQTGTNVQVTTTENVSLSFGQVTSSGVTQVSTTAQAPTVPGGFQVGANTSYYEVTTTASYVPPVTICFPYNPTDYTNPATVKLLHYENGVWNDVTGTIDAINHIACGEVNSLSPFVVANDLTPTVVTLVEFRAKSTGTNHIKLSWRTGSELDILGFNVWRKSGHSGTYQLINQEMIPAKQLGSVTGANYRFNDRDVKPDMTYSYKLEIVTVSNASNWSEIRKVRIK